VAAAVPNEEAVRAYRRELAAAARRFRNYPPQARARGWEGVAEFSVYKTARGEVPAAVLRSSSGYALLDRSAASMLARAVDAVPVPDSLRDLAFDVAMPIRFSLED